MLLTRKQEKILLQKNIKCYGQLTCLERSQCFLLKECMNKWLKELIIEMEDENDWRTSRC